MRQRLLAELTRATVESLGVPAESVRVLLTEIAPEHWAVGGRPRQPAQHIASKESE